MTITYKKVNDPLQGHNTGVNKIQDGVTETVYVPFDESNTDYQEYLEWVAEGNEPEPADEA
jgi:hypothetical protein